PGADASDAARAKATAVAPLLSDAVARATRGLATVRILPVVALAEARPDDASQAPRELARAYFAAGAPRADAILALSDGFDVAASSCACNGWFLRDRAGLDASHPFDDSRAWGDASGTLRGVGFFGTTVEPDDLLAARFLHEFGHAFCCRVAIPGLVDASGSHWARDVAFPDGSIMSGTGAGYDDFALVLMGALAPSDARDAVLPSGDHVGASRLIDALRSAP
ncbi:MAG: hypothetical protein ACYDCK_15445, partial [Thermoplasmatota archaeon]